MTSIILNSEIEREVKAFCRELGIEFNANTDFSYTEYTSYTLHKVNQSQFTAVQLFINYLLNPKDFITIKKLNIS